MIQTESDMAQIPTSALVAAVLLLILVMSKGNSADYAIRINVKTKGS